MSVQSEVAKLGSGVGKLYVVNNDGYIVVNEDNDVQGKAVIDQYILASAPISSEILASSTVVLSGTPGTITNLAYNAVSVFDVATPITGASLTDIATNLTNAINSWVSSPDYTAVQDGTTVYVFAKQGTGSGPNGFVATQSTTGGLVLTPTDMSGGTAATDSIDNQTGYKVYINASSSAVEGTIVGATEITSALVRRPSNSSYEIDSYTISSGIIEVIRKSSITKITVDTEGAVANDDLLTITSDNFNEGDTLVIMGVDAARVTTVKEGGNIELGNNADFLTGDKDNSIELYFSDNTWYEVNRSPGASVDVATMRANGIPEPVSGTNVTTLTAGGGTINLTHGVDKGYQILAGAATLTGSWVIQSAGTPIDGDTFYVDYKAAVISAGNNITIFGATLTDEQMLNGNSLVKATYNASNTTYVVTVTFDANGQDLVNQTDLNTKENDLGNPVTNGQVLSSTTGGVRSWITAGSAYFDSFLTTVNNGASGVETILSTMTIPSGSLATDGDFIRYRFSGTFLSGATTYKTLRLRWNGIAGTILVNNSTVDPTNLDYEVEFDIIRVNNTTVKTSAKMFISTLAVDMGQATIGTLSLSTTAYTLDLTSQTDTAGVVMSVEHVSAGKFIQ